jgi:hypothetical protein
MRLPATAHTDRPWLIHELAHDFDLLDVWALPTPGDRDDFPRLVELMASFDPTQRGPLPARFLFAVRFFLGGVLGLDDTGSGVGNRVPSLRDRLPAELRDAPAGPAPALGFAPLYLRDNEWAAEIANRTMHGILHLGWVPDGDGDGDGGYRGQLAVLVKPNGLFGDAYMAFIKPFRHLLVYPGMLRQLEQDWQRAEVAA